MNVICGAVNRVCAPSAKMQSVAGQSVAKTWRENANPKIENPRAPDDFWNSVPTPLCHNSPERVCLARRRPTSPDELLAVHGIGAKKCAEYGEDLLDEIANHIRQFGITLDAD